MTVKDSKTNSTEPMFLSLREVRMMVDRILLQTQIVAGSQQAVRNIIVGAEAMGLPALQRLDEAFDSIRTIDPAHLRLIDTSDDGAYLSLDASGEHAWGVAVALLELGVDAARRNGAAVVTVRNVREVGMLAGLAALAWGFEVDLQVLTGSGMTMARNIGGETAQDPQWQASDADAGCAVIVLRDRRRQDGKRLDSADDPVMRRILAEGFPSTRGLWERIYTRALGALTPDTVSSRRHAGTIMVDASGKIIGRPDDDDTDFSLLSKPDSTAAA